MRKHRFRESIKSIFGHHVDPEKDEQLKGTKRDIEEKVKKILKLIKNEQIEESDGISTTDSKKGPLVELIEDFHKHYQNLYAQYDHLRGELRKKVHSKQDTDASSYSGSDSDSDSDHSSKGQDCKNGKLESESQKTPEGIEQELETANLEIAELKRKLTATNEEKDALKSEYQTAVSKIQEAEEVIRHLKLEAERLESLFQECKANLEVAERKMEEMAEEFHKNLNSKDQIVTDMKQMVEDLKRDLEAKGGEKAEFINQITEQQRILTEQEDAINRISEEYKQLEISFQESKASLEVKERKMQDLADNHDKNLQLKDQMAANLEHTVEDLKREIEVKGEEISSLVENVRDIEVKLRLSTQKLRVTEQLLSEKEESFRIAEAKFQEEQRRLEEMVEALTGIIVRNNEAHHRMITDLSTMIHSNLTGFEDVVQRYEEDYGHHEHYILETSELLRVAKNWVVEMKSKNEQLKKEVSGLVEQLQGEKERETKLRGRIEALEVNASKEEAEKENLMNAVKLLEKKVELLETMIRDKDDGIMGLGEEKREAIRQLCLWIDYHRNRYEYLKEAISKTGGRGQRAT